MQGPLFSGWHQSTHSSTSQQLQQESTSKTKIEFYLFSEKRKTKSILLYAKSMIRRSLDYREQDGFYIGLTLNRYCCYHILKKDTILVQPDRRNPAPAACAKLTECSIGHPPTHRCTGTTDHQSQCMQGVSSRLPTGHKLYHSPSL